MVSDTDPQMRPAVNQRFSEVVENELLVGTEDWEGIPGQQGTWTSQRRLEFHDEHGKTRLVLREGPHPAGMAEGGRQAWASMFTRLDTLLEGLRRPGVTICRRLPRGPTGPAAVAGRSPPPGSTVASGGARSAGTGPRTARVDSLVRSRARNRYTDHPPGLGVCQRNGNDESDTEEPSPGRLVRRPGVLGRGPCRVERYWQLLATINGWPAPPTLAPVFEWFIQALQHHPSP